MKNKRINIVRSSMPCFDKYVATIRPLWDTCWLTNMGIIHNELEEKLGKYLKVDNFLLVSSGHIALELALQSLDLKGEVITTPFTFASTAHAITRMNLTPIFCDIDPIDYNIDVSKIESLITEKTVAVMPVHVYGNSCKVNEIKKIAEKYNLKVIYDGAHTFGVEIGGEGIANFGDITTFSFHGTKVFHTIEGGGIAVKDKELYEKIKKMRNFGLEPNGDCLFPGTNAKLSEFHAAMGLTLLDIVDDEIYKRKQVYDCYQAHLSNIKGLKLLNLDSNSKQNYIYMPILIEEDFPKSRNILIKELNENNIYPRVYFHPLMNDLTCYNKGFKTYFPNAKYVSERILVLPLYAELSLNDVDMICKVILK